MMKEGFIMWIILAIGSAFFAGVTSILAKCGIKETDSTLATAIRTIVVLLFSWLMVLISGSLSTIGSVDKQTRIFLILSGLSTGASWLCYFKALSLGDVNKVVPIDKLSTVLTIIVALIFLNEGISWIKVIAMILMGVGTLLMIQRKEHETQHNQRGWLIFAILSAVFASLTTILGKIGISGIESNLGTAIRTCVVLVMAWMMVFVAHQHHQLKNINKHELLMICLSGLATGASWLCYYKALQDGLASVVVPIDKLSIVVTITFSYFVLHEKLSRQAMLGLVMNVLGTLLMIV